jgi:hypothetical protein
MSCVYSVTPRPVVVALRAALQWKQILVVTRDVRIGTFGRRAAV